VSQRINESTGRGGHRKWSGVPSTVASWLVVAIIAFPLYWILVLTFEPGSRVYKYPPPLLPSTASFGSFVSLIGGTDVVSWMANSAIVGIITVLVTLVVGIPCAYALACLPVRGRGAMSGVILITQMVPAAVLIVPVYEELDFLHLLNSLFGLTLLYIAFALPVTVWLLRSYFAQLPKELEDAGQVDGCTRFGTLVRIVLPNARPAVATVAFFAFLVSWNEFVFARTVLVSTGRYTMSVGLSTFFGQYTIQWNEIMAGAVLAIVPVVLAYLGVQRYLVGGLLAGAVKG